MIGFSNALLLAGMIAVALPVLIHMLTRPRPRAIKYPTFHLLVQAGSGQQALQRLRTFLILLLRSLLVAAIVLVFTQPFWQDKTEQATTQDPRVVLLVDASMSMGAAQGGVSLFDRARSQAADVLRSLDDGTLVAVIMIGQQPRPLLPVLSRNRSALHEQLSATPRTHELGDPGSALDLAAQMLAGAPGRVIVFSDFQRTNWSDTVVADRPGMHVVLRPVSDTDAQNIGITALTTSPGIPVIGETITLTATLFNATPSRRIEVVRLSFDELTLDTEVELRPFSSADATFTFSMPKPGFYRGRVAVDGDGLPDDDARFVTLRVREALRTLLISDAESTDAQHAAFFVARALSPSTYAATGIDVIPRRAVDLDRGSLETADLFVLTTPVKLTGETADVIVRRVRNGADLVCFMDGPDTVDLINALAGASKGQLTPPFTLTRPVSSPTADLTFARNRQGTLSAFHNSGIEDADLGSMRFSRYFMTDNDPARADELLMTHQDGSAALALWPVGRGEVVLFNFPVTPDAGNIPGNPLFPVLLHETLRILRRGTDHDEARPGTPWMMDVPGGRSSDSQDDSSSDYRVLGPDDVPLNVDVVSRGRTDRLALSAANVPGHYRVYRGDSPVEAGVVNVHPLETDTRRLNLQAIVGSNTTDVTLATDAITSAPTQDHRPLWPALLTIAALCMIAEMLILAWWPTAARISRSVTAGGASA